LGELIEGKEIEGVREKFSLAGLKDEVEVGVSELDAEDQSISEGDRRGLGNERGDRFGGEIPPPLPSRTRRLIPPRSEDYGTARSDYESRSEYETTNSEYSDIKDKYVDNLDKSGKGEKWEKQ